ncbi:MAG TPA: hypothetical protein VF596_18790 [Pyrinomonadaceae bacterium]|jgi:hypothetical protein
MSSYLERQNLKEQIKRKLAALNDSGELMTLEEIETALRLNFGNLGNFVVIRRVSSGGRVRTFSEYCDVFHRHREDVSEGFELISPASGWKLEKAARYLFEQLSKTKEKAVV